MMDKTLKMRAYAGGAETSNLSREQELELELAKKAAQVEEEKKKALETLNALEHMRGVVKQERAKVADLQAGIAAAQARVKELEAALEKIASIAIAPVSSGSAE